MRGDDCTGDASWLKPGVYVAYDMVGLPSIYGTVERVELKRTPALVSDVRYRDIARVLVRLDCGFLGSFQAMWNLRPVPDLERLAAVLDEEVSPGRVWRTAD